jgi:antitoxin ParD1/3/4
MPNVHLTIPMQDYAERQIRSGAYANLSEVVRAGMRTLMEKDRARAFLVLKAELAEAIAEAERGGFKELDPVAFEPEALQKASRGFADDADLVRIAKERQDEPSYPVTLDRL